MDEEPPLAVDQELRDRVFGVVLAHAGLLFIFGGLVYVTAANQFVEAVSENPTACWLVISPALTGLFWVDAEVYTYLDRSIGPHAAQWWFRGMCLLIVAGGIGVVVEGCS